MTTRDLELLPPSHRLRPAWVALIQGPSGVYHFAHEVIGRQLLGGKSCLLLDGANRFNPYAISRLAQMERVKPVSLLKRIKLSRAFTCYQYLSLLRAVNLSEVLSASTLLVLFGPLDLFMDEDITLAEAQRCWTECQEELHTLIHKGTAVLMVSHTPERFPDARKVWWHTLEPFVDERWTVEAGGRNFTRLEIGSTRRVTGRVNDREGERSHRLRARRGKPSSIRRRRDEVLVLHGPLDHATERRESPVGAALSWPPPEHVNEPATLPDSQPTRKIGINKSDLLKN